MKTAQLDELEYEPEFETDEEDLYDQKSYIFDPDMKEDEEIIYDPARRRRRRPTRRRRYSPKVIYRYVKKKIKRKKPKWLGWQTLLAIPITVVSFIMSMQQDTLKWFVEKAPERIMETFSGYELLKTLSGGWGRPKNIIEYFKNVLTSPFGLGGIALTVYALLPFRRLPLKRIALICGGSLLLGSLLGSAFHASNGNTSRRHSGHSGNIISEREAYSHVLGKDPFNSTYA